MSRFPADIIAAAQASQKKWGPPASCTLAQWALESAYGTRMSGRNNPFGIKAKTGTAVLTHEQDAAGRATAIRATFADFASVAESFDGHGKLLATDRHYANCRAIVAAGIESQADAKAYARALQRDGYATDVSYAEKLISIMDANNLYQFDRPAPDVRPPIPREPPVTPKAPSKKTIPVVVAGMAASTTVIGATTKWEPVYPVIIGICVVLLVMYLIMHFRKI